MSSTKQTFHADAVTDSACYDTEKTTEYFEEVSVGNVKVLSAFRFAKDIVIAAFVSYLILGVLFNVVIVRGDSMNPTLTSGTIIVVNRAFYTPTKGDIIVCTPETYDAQLVKRVIGIGGDTVDIDFESGIVYVNGEALQEDYVAAPTFKDLGAEFPVTIPEGKVFVLGDNRNNSYDSRLPAIGLVSDSAIRGGYIFTVLK